jgi:peptidyl-prolyl cis-trans isomerase D
MTPETYEDNKKYELRIEKLQSFIMGSIKVSEAEALETYKWMEEQVSVDHVVFKPSDYTDVEVTPEQIKAYFSEHQKDYEIPPKVKVQYLMLDFKTFEAEAKVADEEVSTYFDLNKETYAQPKRVKARHILFKAGPDGEQGATEAARKKALDVLKELGSGADFGELARKYSDDPGSRDKGGDLGFFDRERMVKPFSDAAFAMKTGEISEPIKTPFGWHIIKVEEIQEAKEPVLAEVADQIREKLAKDAARTNAFDRAEEVYDSSYGAGNISDAASRHQLRVHETEYFPEEGPVPGIKDGRRFAETAFSLDENEVSEPLELSEGYYMLQLVAKEPSRIPELEGVKDKVKRDVIGDRRDELAKADAQDFLNDLKGGAEFKQAAESRGVKAETTGFFGRSGAVVGMGMEPKIQDTAFSLSPSRPLPDAVIKGSQGYHVISFKARQPVDPKDFEDKKSQIMSSILMQKRQGAIDEFLALLRERSEISIQEGFLD